MSEHTPGPWHVGADWPQIVAVYDDNSIYIACANTGLYSEWVDTNPIGLKKAKANARLIAASPDLLEACRIALLHAPSIRLAAERRHTIAVLTAAIAKAKGEHASGAVASETSA